MNLLNDSDWLVHSKDETPVEITGRCKQRYYAFRDLPNTPVWNLNIYQTQPVCKVKDLQNGIPRKVVH